MYLVALAASISSARADGYSLDIELLRPSFTPGHLFGVDGPEVAAKGQLMMGSFSQFQREPLVLYEFGQESDVVIGTRNAWHMGASYGLYDNVAVRGTLPMALQWGGDRNEYQGSSSGFGDLGVGVTWLALRPREVSAVAFQLGVKGDFFAPTATRQAYMGEEDPRFAAGLLASLDVGPVETMVDATLVSRELVSTDADFDLGNELASTVGLRYALRPGLKLGVTGLTRGGLSKFLQGGAENVLETVGGVQVSPNERVQIDLGIGRGLVEGYGTTKLRGVLGVTFLGAVPEEPEVFEPDIIVERIERSEPPDIDLPFDDSEADIRVGEREVETRDPVRFYLGTADLLPESLPILKDMASTLAERPDIAEITIVGHASFEGSDDYNYYLSRDRATAIYEALISAGVPPQRLAMRWYGEQAPTVDGEVDEHPEEDRRVEFLITRRLLQVEEPPVYPDPFLAPWGEWIELAKPDVVAPPVPERLDVDQFDPDDE